MRELIAYLIFLTGFGFLAVGAYGMSRSQDFFINITFSSFFDTIGLFSMGIGLVVYLGFHIASLKLLTVLFLFLLLNPLVTHTLARSANMFQSAPSKEVRK